jgi:hypothetical protein
VTPIRRLDIGFFPGAVFLLEGAEPSDVPRIKEALQSASDSILTFRDSDYIIEPDQEGLAGYPDETPYVAILTRSGLAGALRIGTLAHECVHAAFRVLGDAGVVPGDQSEEVYAYLIGHLLEQALEEPETT